ncbi:ABC transporter permease [Streptomyces ovatisporus]|uniref:ABC transporter permease n=1 Tax=Streptomyces ovatisporus TaxID=1128682 RepID=A0ABV9AA20_9ACTN
MSPAPNIAPGRTGATEGGARNRPAAPSRSRLPLGPRGLTWVLLRVHRGALALWGIFVTCTALAFVYLHFLGKEVERSQAPGCGNARETALSCGPAEMNAYDSYGGLLEVGAGLFTFLPFVIAVWAGGALVGREFERDTTAIAWTQSVSPVRWLATKVALSALLITVGTAGLTVLFRWIWLSAADIRTPVWYEADSFHATGPAGPAYALLGLAAGVFAGVLLRRTLPAIGAAAGALGLVYFVCEAYRFDLWPKTRLTGDKASNLPSDAYQAELGVIKNSGERVNELVCFDTELPAVLQKCLAEHDAQGVVAVIHPESHFWPLQLVETGVVLAVAAALTAAAFRLVRRRTP